MVVKEKQYLRVSSIIGFLVVGLIMYCLIEAYNSFGYTFEFQLIRVIGFGIIGVIMMIILYDVKIIFRK